MKSEGYVASTILIDSFNMFHEAILSYGKRIIAYRGVRDASYLLIPKIGRIEFLNKSKMFAHEERVIFDRFRAHALPYLRVACSTTWHLATHWRNTMAYQPDS